MPMSHVINASLRELKRELCLGEYERVLKPEPMVIQGDYRNQLRTNKAISSGLHSQTHNQP